MAVGAGRRLKALVVGGDGELRLAINEAILLAAQDTDLPPETSPQWVADVLIEGRTAVDSVPQEVAGIADDSPLELYAPDFSSHLAQLISSQLKADLADVGVDCDELFQHFSARFIEVVRRHAVNADSSLIGLAGRIEAAGLERSVDAIARSTSVNIEATLPTLLKLRQESETRIRRRLDALGAPSDLTDLLLTSIADVALPALPDVGTVAIEAEPGSGKSTLAERIHLGSIETALVDETAPLPVFIEAKRLTTPITIAIDRMWGANRDSFPRGIDLIVDGVDEIGTDASRELMLDVRSVTRDPLSPVVRSIVTFRSHGSNLEFEHRAEVPLLTEDQAAQLIRALSGSDRPAYLRTDTLRAAVRRPFFAIAVGLELRNRSGTFLPTTSRMIQSVVERALSQESWDSASEVLGKAAAASVDVGHRPVPLSRLALTSTQVLALRRSRLIRIVDEQSIIFDVALIAEWLAADHFKRNLELISELVSNPIRLDRWRYPLLLVIETQNQLEIEAVLSTLARKAPTMAGWLLSQPDPFDLRGLGQPIEPMDRAEDDHTFAKMMRLAFDSFKEGLGSSCEGMWLLGMDSLPPLFLRTSGHSCEYSWHRPSEDLPDILDVGPPPPNELFVEWMSMVSFTVTNHPAWMWRHVMNQTREMLKASITTGHIFADSDIARCELDFIIGLKALDRRGSINPGIIRVESLRERLQFRDNLLREMGLNDTSDDAETAELRDLVNRMDASGKVELASPWAMPDSLAEPTGWVWGLWTTEGLLNRVRDVTLAGLKIYGDCISNRLVQFGPYLGSSSNWPVRLVGYMTRGRPDDGFGGQPTFLWYVEPNAETVEVRWELVDDMAEVDRRLQENGTVRRWTWGVMSGLFHPDPAIAFAIVTLWSDLHEWSWTDGGTPRM